MTRLIRDFRIIPVVLVAIYIGITTVLTIRYRAKTSEDFMVAARSVPALVIGVLMMSEFIAPKSTIGVAQAAFESGIAASWAVASVSIGFLLFGWVLATFLSRGRQEAKRRPSYSAGRQTSRDRSEKP